MGASASKQIEERHPSNYVGCLMDMTHPGKVPLIFSEEYNITFGGMEKLHPFDSGKWGKIVHFLKDESVIEDANIICPKEALDGDLLVVHTHQYLSSLKSSWRVAMITEVPFVAFVPNSIVQRVLLKCLRLQTGGTILAARLALEYGWAINVGGGFHHCSSDAGGGFCAFADISLAIKFLMNELHERVHSAMIIDLDAHQGNGHERDFTNDRSVYILDVYNASIYPGDFVARAGISLEVRLRPFTSDAEYLKLVERNINKALDSFNPDIIVYNAGTDILEGDPLGLLNISADGVIKRDELVFQAAAEKKIPVLMLTSGGYQRSTARIIADSILNLNKKNLIQLQLPHSLLQDPTDKNGAKL